MTSARPGIAWHARVASALMAGIVAAGVGRAVSIWHRLPARMASHFDAAGRPNGWSSPSQFLLTYGIVMGATVLLLGTAPLWLTLVPPTVINLPNREHWLSPEHRTDSLRRLSAFMAWFGVATAAFGFAILEQVISANLGQKGAPIAGFYWAVGAYLLFVGVWTVRLYRAFPRPV